MKRITTESEWLACFEPKRMVKFLGDRLSDRKYRLLMVNSCRLLWDSLPDPRSRAAVEAAERFADGEISQERLQESYRPSSDAHAELRADAGGGRNLAVRAALAVMYNVYGQKHWQHFQPQFNARTMFAALKLTRVAERPLRGQMADLVRDLAGNPFRPPPVTVAPEWQTPTVLAVARGVYDGRSFHDLPVLADALQDAGCDDEHVLDHCRGPGPHARGWWTRCSGGRRYGSGPS